MKKIFTLLTVALFAMSASAGNLTTLKKMSLKNSDIMMVSRPTVTPIIEAGGEWVNAPAPFAPLYNVTGSTFDSDWIEATPWQMSVVEYDYEGETWYALKNVIPNEDMWVEDPLIDYYYNEAEGQIVIPCTPLAQYDENSLIYIMDIYDFTNGGTGDIYFTLDKDANFARTADAFTHSVGWAVAEYDKETYEPTQFLGYYNVYAEMTYSIDPTSIAAITAQKEKKVSKFFKDGKLVIVKDGKKYNAVGQRM